MPSTFPDPAHPNTSAPLAGDIARRRARLGLLAFLIAVPISWALFSQIEPIWARIMPLEGFTFMTTATLLGAVLAVVPLVAIIGFVLAIWFGVDSVYMTKRRASRLLDQFIVAVALVVWFSPALFGVVTAGRAIYEGRIHFVRPPRDYFLATDPIAFWEGVGFWLIMSGLFSFLAWRYWRPRLLLTPAAQD